MDDNEIEQAIGDTHYALLKGVADTLETLEWTICVLAEAIIEPKEHLRQGLVETVLKVLREETQEVDDGQPEH